MTHLKRGDPGTTKVRGLLQADALGDLEQQVALLLGVLCVRALVVEQTAVNPSGDLVSDLQRASEVVSELDHCAGVVASDDGVLGGEERLVLPVCRVLRGDTDQRRGSR